ncbi:MAG: hypothetical protein AB2652_04825 [Candidatus Thiodiazotropha endolucinida]
MAEYQFQLTFNLPGDEDDPQRHLDALYAAGCDDAVVGVGTPGSIALQFSRKASTEEEAISTAIGDVYKAVPGAALID